MQRPDQDAAHLLRGLADIYQRAGQSARALVMLLLASQITPDDPVLLRSLAVVFTAVGDGQRALAALDRLSELEPHAAAAPPTELLLLRSRALLRAGRDEEGRELFRHYLAQRRSTAA